VSVDPAWAADSVASNKTFEAFMQVEGARLRRVLTAHFGIEVGPDVAADALAWAWEHWDDVRSMVNPVGYLYRVGQSSARRHRRWARRVVLPPEDVSGDMPMSEPGLDAALTRLSAAQRVAVVLVHGLDWSYQDTADVLGVPVSSVRNYVHRGLERLRRELGEA
jgi:DNA-directed RNA polymerase specialized sigma24 family protein